MADAGGAVAAGAIVVAAVVGGAVGAAVAGAAVVAGAVGGGGGAAVVGGAVVGGGGGGAAVVGGAGGGGGAAVVGGGGGGGGAGDGRGRSDGGESVRGEELAGAIAADAHTDATEVRVDQVLVVAGAGDERVEERADGATHAHVLATLAPIREDRSDRGSEVRVVGDAAGGDHVVVPGARRRGQPGVRCQSAAGPATARRLLILDTKSASSPGEAAPATVGAATIAVPTMATARATDETARAIRCTEFPSAWRRGHLETNLGASEVA